jgi:hypothetical protein
MIEFYANHVDIHDGDESCQLLLAVDRDGDGPYLLLQRNSVDDDCDDNDDCYVETNDPEHCGHCAIGHLHCSMTELQLTLQRAEHASIRVHFQLNRAKFEALKSIPAALAPACHTSNDEDSDL